MAPTSGKSFLFLAIAIVFLAVLHQSAQGFKHSEQCKFRGYKPGGILPGITAISAVPPAKFESSVLDDVFTYFNKGGATTAATLAVIDSAGVVLKGSPQVAATLGIIAVGVGFASDTPSPDDILERAFKSVELLTEEVNIRMSQLQDYSDVKDLQLEKTIMSRNYKELFDKWSKCAKHRPGRDPNQCQTQAEGDIESARYHFQPVQSEFDEKRNGKQKYDPHFYYRYVATWQWMEEMKGSGLFWALTYEQVKKLEIGLIPFRDYATLHLIALEALANSYKDKVGDLACKSYKHTLSLIVEKSDYYVRYVKWAYEWIYIRQYEENMYFGVKGRSGGGPDSATRNGFMATRKCSGGKCTIECSQMMKDNICTVQRRRRRKRSYEVMRKANSLCDEYMGQLKRKLTEFWTENVLDVANRWEKYGEDAKKKLAAKHCKFEFLFFCFVLFTKMVVFSNEFCEKEYNSNSNEIHEV